MAKESKVLAIAICSECKREMTLKEVSWKKNRPLCSECAEGKKEET
jgi:formylmethanofuran dehydrogenase subunit E